MMDLLGTVSVQALEPVLVVRIETNPDERLAHCAWCWEKRHPDGTLYPRTWSSTMCQACEAEARCALLRRRRERTVVREGRVNG